MKEKRETGIIIVGSGAGGATLANELTRQGSRVTVIEQVLRVKKIGTVKSALGFYNKHGFLKSKEGTILYRTTMAGGTTVVSCGSGIRSLQKEFSDLGIDLEEEFAEAEKELAITQLTEEEIIGGSREIMKAAQELGYQMKPMPKFVDLRKCRACGNCVLGCKFNAKWTAVDYLEQSIENGASLITQSKVVEVLNSNGKVTGVRVIGPNGLMEVMSDIVVLTAGGIGTPVILQKSGIDAGKKLFCDLFNVTYGVTENISQLRGMNMAVIDDEFYRSKGFILSTFMDLSLLFILSFGWRFLSGKLHRKRTLGIMTKIRDESIGRVSSIGKIEKPVTSKDREKLKQGVAISREILIKAGAKPESIFVTQPSGAHPGGTAAIGEVVNTNLETEIKNLFVCDASVFPTAPGLPPILTIVALAKWLAKKLVSA